ncbi:RNA-directed DNA polymerase from mobile element jockey [Willisornis vidua]|uniref:RNA-directed DNA polymerase from mobile element jockey n=1 Tax=Willisornis vidua TaxID=1566151 RepID=A0ABQ9D4F5_9PASS|nr:RNA-directed DNA polymerase from mobile element jockey [Willisornis vidua]
MTDQGRLSALNWRTMTVKMISSVNPETLQDLLFQLDPCKSVGLDGTHPRILKELADVITKPLLMISEYSWESGEALADCQLANVQIFKKSKKQDPRNRRPVSLTSMSVKL